MPKARERLRGIWSRLNRHTVPYRYRVAAGIAGLVLGILVALALDTDAIVGALVGAALGPIVIELAGELWLWRRGRR